MIYKLGEHTVSTNGNDFFIAPSASVMGRVFLEKHVSVWFGAVVRGDVEDIKIGENSKHSRFICSACRSWPPFDNWKKCHCGT